MSFSTAAGKTFLTGAEFNSASFCLREENCFGSASTSFVRISIGVLTGMLLEGGEATRQTHSSGVRSCTVSTDSGTQPRTLFVTREPWASPARMVEPCGPMSSWNQLPGPVSFNSSN